ncbi:hypothetical protein GTA08_BOTSDO07557 [Botryosphaeria dothidea]|uniref:Fungal N-terminal domain-containing protein n=1 Tax=Botryosphaeria dothidea TaxID=55169 RepID=A0A8H4N0N2_9PEZI|nr:hypothetical protein GTA08_BOTSDO07557 [Botryosphaeria dothidea]
MEPVSASIGLAASLVTLIEVAGKSYSALSKFAHRMKHAPKNIQKLCSQVTSLQSLLSIIQGFVDPLRVEDISPELRSLWNSKMSSIRDDLDTLGEQAEKLNLMLNGGTHATWRARLKKVLSDEDIARYKHLLQNYIHDLQLIEAHFKSHKLHDLHLTISAIHTHTEIINKRVESIQPNLKREMKAQFTSLEHVLLRHFEDEDRALDTIRNTGGERHVRRLVNGSLTEVLPSVTVISNPPSVIVIE